MSIVLLNFAPDDISSAAVESVRQAAPDMQVVVTRDHAEIESQIADIEIIAGHFPPELVSRATALRWYQQWGAGADWLIRYPEAIERDFLLTNSSGVHAIPISEQIIGTLLMFSRGLHHAVRAQTKHEWRRAALSEIFELDGKTMLLVGVGAIGERTALLASALGMRVEGIRRNTTRSVASVAAMYAPEQLRERLAHADVVVLTVPLSHETQGMIGVAELQAMKPTAYLVNIGRGGTIDEPALVQALAEQRIAGAALDVFIEEPLPATSPLWAMENVIITGHYAGVTPKYEQRAMAIFLDNMQRYRAGTPLRNLVDKRAMY